MLSYSHQKSSTKWGFHRNFAIFMGKHMCQSLVFKKSCNCIEKRLRSRFFSREFCKIFMKTFSYNTSGGLLLWVKKISMCFHWKQISVASSLQLGFLNSILHWTGHTFVCILSLYSSYFVAVSLVKIKNWQLPPRNILHIDSVLSGK